MPLNLVDYDLSDSMREEYNTLMHDVRLDTLVRQQRFNRLLHQIKQSYHEYLIRILFPREAYLCGVFPIPSSSFYVVRSMDLYGALSAAVRGFSKDNVDPDIAKLEWQDHWLSLSEDFRFEELQLKSNVDFFSRYRHNENGCSPEEKERYVAAIRAFKKYSFYCNTLKNGIEGNISLCHPRVFGGRSELLPGKYTNYINFIDIISFDLRENSAMNSGRLCDWICRLDNMAQDIMQMMVEESLHHSGDYSDFRIAHQQNIAILRARIATFDALNQLEWSRNISRAVLLMSAVGLVVAALGLGLAYCNVIALALTISHYLYGLLATSALGYGYAMSRLMYFNHHHVNNNLPPLEILDKMPVENLVRESLSLVFRPASALI